MAKVIATISGTALVPGVSRNRRWYTREAIAKAVARAQGRIAAGTEPMVMLTHHQAGDDSAQITGRITSMSVAEDGSARYVADIADTPAGRTIASLVDTSDGKPAFLQTGSIRGAWLGTVRRVTAPDGESAETSNDLEFEGIDFTRKPGVPGAQVDAFAWANGATETTERVLITESVQEARVTIMDETAPAKAEKSCEELGHTCCKEAAAPAEALAILPPVPHVLENGVCTSCVAEGGDAPGDGSKPYGNVVYADPGYQSDKKRRYPVDTKAHVKAALAYLAQKANAAKYTPAQLKRVMGRIRAAAKKFGVTVAAESAGWTFDEPAQVSEAVAEYFGDPSCAGSWSVNASNGPVSICLSSYSMPPEDLDVILRAAADAACKALATLDPDMDGDIDLPGAAASDTDHDGGESAPDDEETETDPAASPAAATTETEEPAMAADTTTPAEQAAPALDQDKIIEAVLAAMDKREEARAAREKAAAEEAAAKKAALEAEDARISALVEAKVAERVSADGDEAGAPAEETEEQRIERMVEERVVTRRQELAERGVGTGRKGLTTGAVDEHRAPRNDGGTPELNAHGMPGTFPDKPANKLSATELRANAAPYLATYVFGDRAQKFG